MYKIGELSRLCSLPVKTLRYYDSEGLLPPDRIDPFTGYRYYTAARIADCHRIVALKALGFTLDEIRQQLQKDSVDDILYLIDEKRRYLQKQSETIARQCAALDDLRDTLCKGETSMVPIQIFKRPAIHIVGIRRLFADREEAVACLQEIRAALPKFNVGAQDIIINHETEFNTFPADMTVGAALSAPLTAVYTIRDCPVQTFSLPDADTAQLICPTAERDNGYHALFTYLDKENCQTMGSVLEQYLEDETVLLSVPMWRLSKTPVNTVPSVETLPFCKDSEVLGKWELVDLLPSAEQFCPQKRKYSGNPAEIWLKELYFMPNGEGYWIIQSWTRGSFVTTFSIPKHTLRHSYEIRDVDGQSYLFAAIFDDYEHFRHGGKPNIYVYQKVSDRIYTKDDIRRKDNVNLPYVPDNTVLGTWKVRDFVQSRRDFDPTIQRFDPNGLYFIGVRFLPDGTAETHYQNDPCWYPHRYTKGYLLQEGQQISEQYELCDFDGKVYLFVQWKSGDYVFGGRKPSWYVFEKADE